MRSFIVVVLAGVLVATGAAPASAAPDTTPPTTPGNFRVTGWTANTVSLAWTASTDNSGAFTYFLGDNFGGGSYLGQTVTTSTRTGLWPSTTYTFTIVAYDAARNYSGTAVVQHTTPPDTTPPSSPVLTVTYLAPARASVTWTRSTDNSGSLVSHTLLVDGAPRTGDMGGGLGQVLLDLTPATTYQLVVRARDPSGNTSLSNTVTLTTPARTDFTPPTAPANLRGRSDVSGCEVYLNWDQSTDNVDTQNRLLYRFRVNGTLAPVRSFVIGRGTNVGASVLEGQFAGPNTFTVEAVDGSGTVSPLSNVLTINIPAC